MVKQKVGHGWEVHMQYSVIMIAVISFASESVGLRQKMSDHACAAFSLVNMGHLYQMAGSNEDALNYYRQSLDYAVSKGVKDINMSLYYESFGNAFRAIIC